MNRRISFAIRFLGVFLLLLFFATLFSGLEERNAREAGNTAILPAEENAGTSGKKPRTVILDAGHGGEDGGTVSAGGIYEKDVNLALTLTLAEQLRSAGVNVILTREEDTLLYDKNADYTGRKKSLDLAARLKIGKETPDALFVSIHQNSYPVAKYRGLQVWYSKRDPRSEICAEAVQTAARRFLQPENTREPKAATSAIYLLYHADFPAILVECGFLSNPDEAALLATEEYRKQVAAVLCNAILAVTEPGGTNF